MSENVLSDVNAIDSELHYEFETSSYYDLYCKRKYKRNNDNNLLIFSLPSSISSEVERKPLDLKFNIISKTGEQRTIATDPKNQEKFRITALLVAAGEIKQSLAKLENYISRKIILKIPELMEVFESDLRTTIEEIKEEGLINIRDKQKRLLGFSKFFGNDTIPNAVIEVGDAAFEREIKLFREQGSTLESLTNESTRGIFKNFNSIVIKELNISLKEETLSIQSPKETIITILKKMHKEIRNLFKRMLESQLFTWEEEYFGKLDSVREDMVNNVRLVLDEKVKERGLPPPPSILTKPILSLVSKFVFRNQMKEIKTKIDKMGRELIDSILTDFDKLMDESYLQKFTDKLEKEISSITNDIYALEIPSNIGDSFEIESNLKRQVSRQKIKDSRVYIKEQIRTDIDKVKNLAISIYVKGDYVVRYPTVEIMPEAAKCTIEEPYITEENKRIIFRLTELAPEVNSVFISFIVEKKDQFIELKKEVIKDIALLRKETHSLARSIPIPQIEIKRKMIKTVQVLTFTCDYSDESEEHRLFKQEKDYPITVEASKYGGWLKLAYLSARVGISMPLLNIQKGIEFANELMDVMDDVKGLWDEVSETREKFPEERPMLTPEEKEMIIKVIHEKGINEELQPCGICDRWVCQQHLTGNVCTYCLNTIS